MNKTDKNIKMIAETRNTCQSCGKIWHYGKEEVDVNNSNKAHQVSKGMLACSCCFPLAFVMPDRNIIDLDKCPACNSKSIKKEIITHEI